MPLTISCWCLWIYSLGVHLCDTLTASSKIHNAAKMYQQGCDWGFSKNPGRWISSSEQSKRSVLAAGVQTFFYTLICILNKSYMDILKFFLAKWRHFEHFYQNSFFFFFFFTNFENSDFQIPENPKNPGKSHPVPIWNLSEFNVIWLCPVGRHIKSGY